MAAIGNDDNSLTRVLRPLNKMRRKLFDCGPGFPHSARDIGLTRLTFPCALISIAGVCGIGGIKTIAFVLMVASERDTRITIFLKSSATKRH